MLRIAGSDGYSAIGRQRSYWPGGWKFTKNVVTDAVRHGFDDRRSKTADVSHDRFLLMGKSYVVW